MWQKLPYVSLIMSPLCADWSCEMRFKAPGETVDIHVKLFPRSRMNVCIFFCSTMLIVFAMLSFTVKQYSVFHQYPWWQVLHKVYNGECIPHFICRTIYHNLCSATAAWRTLENTENDLFQAAPWLSCLQVNMKTYTHPQLVLLESLLAPEISGLGPWRSPGELLKTEMDARLPPHGFSSVTAFMAHYLSRALHPHNITVHRPSDRWPSCWLH